MKPLYPDDPCGRDLKYLTTIDNKYDVWFEEADKNVPFKVRYGPHPAEYGWAGRLSLSVPDDTSGQRRWMRVCAPFLRNILALIQ